MFFYKVFEDVVDILDPEMNLVDDEEGEEELYEEDETEQKPTPQPATSREEKIDHEQE